MALDTSIPVDSQQLPTYPAQVRAIYARLNNAYHVYALYFAVSGALATGVNKSWEIPVQMDLNQAPTIMTVVARVKTAPTGASLIVDVRKNGTTIFTNTSARPTIPTGTFISPDAVPDATSLTQNDVLSIDITQVGSTIAGSDLTVALKIMQTLWIP
jgi:hypothetical protein